MNTTTLRVTVAALAAGAALTFLLLPAANSQMPQMRASPSFLPIGVAASGSGASTVWFHEPSTGRALACQTVSTAGAGLSGIQCVSTRLPTDTP